MKLPTRHFALAATVLLLSVRVHAQSPSLTPMQWRQDLTFLMERIRTVHPAPFHRGNETAMTSAARALERDIPTLSPQRIALRMMAIVAMINDGHSRLQPAAPVFARDRVFPLRIERFVDGIHIVGARPDQADLLGRRIVRIGSMKVEVVWDSLMVLTSGDNVFSKMAGVPALFTMPEVMAGLGLSAADTVRLVVSDGTREIARPIAAIPSQGPIPFSAWKGPGGASQTIHSSNADIDLAYRNREQSYWYVRDGALLYAQINQVGNGQDTVSLGTERAVVTLGQFGERLMREVTAGGVQRLVIDLRYNGGGNNDLARGVVAAIASQPSINVRGRLFVITGRETYSAAMNFTSMMEERTNALFVGEPPGGAPLHYGDNTGFTLPHSKLPFRISLLRWDLGVRPTDVRDVMEPDLPIAPTFAHVREGKDGALDAIRTYTDGVVLADRLRARFLETGLDSAFALYRSRMTDVPAPWRSGEQQLIRFLYGVLGRLNTRSEIFRAFAFATEMHPTSAQAWFERGRVHSFVSDWPEATKAFARARELSPGQDLIRRSHEAARARQ